MILRTEQLARHLQDALRPLYVLHGDETLLVQETADTIRAAARRAGYTERKVHHVGANAGEWARLFADTQSRSLFADRQLLEINLPGGKPGKEGGEALQRLAAMSGDDMLTLVLLPRLDRQQLASAWFTALDSAGVTIKVDSVARPALPAWIAGRLAAQGQRVEEGEAGRLALEFFADCVEGHLLAAHQEVVKLGLLHPPGVLTQAQLEAAIARVARYDVFKFTEAVLGAQVARLRRMLHGLRDEGVAAVLVHWTLAEDLRALKRIKDAQQQGQPLALALRDNRIWGPKEQLVERLLPRLGVGALTQLVEAAQICDGIVKGLPDPQWPRDPWLAIERLALATAGAVRGGASAPLILRAGV